MSGQDVVMPVEPPRLLARDYWLILSTPGRRHHPGGDRRPRRPARRLAPGLERDGVLFLSGPLLSGPGTGPGSGVTVLRAAGQDEAQSIAARDPFVLAGLRRFTVHRWRLNEGSIGVRLSLGGGRYDWR